MTGAEIGGAVLGIGSDLISGSIQQSRNESLMDKQKQNQMEINKYNQKLQQQTWDYTNYENQVKHLESAGLNPALLYGGGGGGGATTGSQGGSAAGSSVSAQNSAIAGMGMGMQLELLKAQKENIEADTRKKTIEADVTGGVGVQKTMQETSNIAQDTINKQAQELLTKAQTKIAEIQGNVDETTKDDKIKQIKAQAVGELLKNTLMESGVEVNEAQINKMAQDISQGWRKLSIDEFKAEIDANFQGIMPRIGNRLGAIYDGVLKVMGIKDIPNMPYKIDKK